MTAVGVTYSEQWRAAAATLRKKADELDEIADTAPKRPQPQLDAMKVRVCEYLLKVNADHDGPFIPPTAIDWLGNGIVHAVLESDSDSGAQAARTE